MTLHSSLSEEEQKIEAYTPILSTIFPGINYFSTTGFNEAMEECGAPALKKLFPELETANEDEFDPDELVELSEFKPSNGCEWQDSEEWRKEFNQLLMVA